MSGWTDPEIIAQMEQTAQSGTTGTDWEKAFEMCDAFEARGGAHGRAYARAVRPILVLTKEMQEAAEAGKAEEAASILFGIIMGLAVCYASLVDMGSESIGSILKLHFETHYNNALTARKAARDGRKS